MSDVVIKVENLGKQYRLGQIGTGTIANDLTRWWANIRGKEDPFLKIGDENDRSAKAVSDYVWALQDINFEVKRGDVLGIIGKNGAGKSTLLKILSQVTTPTLGEVKIKGRVASLLEVGTGFNPDLTGRDNVFLNGAILGMTKHEIKNKFDEIVEFSGVERYIDTPVKRYSSGMYVRLAFAVAAHLEPEILIVDEVLAVGDAEFQKKCLGKMKDVSGEGRTVLFVSHNMAAMNQLCDKGLLIHQGRVLHQGSIEDVIPFYLRSSFSNAICGDVEFETNDKPFQFKKITLKNAAGEIINKSISQTDSIFIEANYVFRKEVKKCNLTITVKNNNGEIVWFLDRSDFHKEFYVAQPGVYFSRIQIPNPLLKSGSYVVTFGFSDAQGDYDDHKRDILQFEIENTDSLRANRAGNLFVPLQWEMSKIEN